MRVACLQLSPVHGDIAASQARADELLASLSTSEALDLLVLPELAFSGYTFKDREEVLPLAEVAGGGGPVATWCLNTASRLLCAVCCGYIELASDGRLFNSQLVVGRDGAVLGHHRKKHLFATDEAWSQEGEAWNPVVSVAGRRAFLGICMDINPYRFEAPFEAYEWATAAVNAQAEILCFSSAWCDRSPLDPPSYIPPPVNAEKTRAYWASRLLPLVVGHRCVHFIAADRIGKEGNTTFCGSSCVMRLGGGDVEVLAALGATEQGVLVAEL
jgi:protein N-terminal amidase